MLNHILTGEDESLSGYQKFGGQGEQRSSLSLKSYQDKQPSFLGESQERGAPRNISGMLVESVLSFLLFTCVSLA